MAFDWEQFHRRYVFLIWVWKLQPRLTGANELTCTFLLHGPLARYAKLRVAHAPGMPGTFSPPPRVSDLDMHHGTCVTHVPWCMPGSLTTVSIEFDNGENVPGIPGACATRNFTYLIRGTLLIPRVLKHFYPEFRMTSHWFLSANHPRINLFQFTNAPVLYRTCFPWYVTKIKFNEYAWKFSHSNNFISI